MINFNVILSVYVIVRELVVFIICKLGVYLVRKRMFLISTACGEFLVDKDLCGISLYRNPMCADRQRGSPTI